MKTSEKHSTKTDSSPLNLTKKNTNQFSAGFSIRPPLNLLRIKKAQLLSLHVRVFVVVTSLKPSRIAAVVAKMRRFLHRNNATQPTFLTGLLWFATSVLPSILKTLIFATMVAVKIRTLLTSLIGWLRIDFGWNLHYPCWLFCAKSSWTRLKIENKFVPGKSIS